VANTNRGDTFVTRKVFPSWSIVKPLAMEETFVHEGEGYWHAYKRDRSISLTSMTVFDGPRPVPAVELVRVFRPDYGTPLDSLPPGLQGWAITDAAGETARASRLLSGIVAVDGRVLIATITCDDEAWSRRIWLSIRNHPVSAESAALDRVRQRLGAPA
jgi:hypothetical protein